MNEELVIEIDYRERERKGATEPTVPEELEKLIKKESLGIKFVFKQLDIADYKIVLYQDGVPIKWVLCERKSPVDFCNSEYNLHKNNQVFDMATNEPFSIFFVEGDLLKEVERRYGEPAYCDYWMKCAFFGTTFKKVEQGVSGWVLPIRTYNQSDTARWLRVIYDKVKSGEWVRFREMERDGKGKPTDNDWLVFIVSSFRGIGKTRAIELLNKYKTLRALMTSTDWKCKGVGDKTNAEVQSLLDYEYRV
jgi:ERCC4-type nuclease